MYRLAINIYDKEGKYEKSILSSVTSTYDALTQVSAFFYVRRCNQMSLYDYTNKEFTTSEVDMVCNFYESTGLASYTGLFKKFKSVDSRRGYFIVDFPEETFRDENGIDELLQVIRYNISERILYMSKSPDTGEEVYYDTYRPKGIL